MTNFKKLPEIPEKDLIWLAGFWEGEGCFTHQQHKYPVAHVTTTDADVALYVADLLDCNISAYQPKNPLHSKSYRINTTGKKAEELMLLLYPYMYSRRKARIKELLEEMTESRVR